MNGINVENIHKAFELIKWNTKFNGRALNVFDENDKFTGWELFNDTLEYRSKEGYAVYIYLNECDIKFLDGGYISIKGKDSLNKNNPPIFVHFYNFNLNKKSEEK